MNNQRWIGGRESYRPPTERIVPSEYDVVELHDDTTARDFVETHHYSRSYPSAIRRFGLFRFAQLVGVAVFSWPVSRFSATNLFGALPHKSCLDLGRFVLLDEVPGMGETWMLARCFAQLRQLGYLAVISFSDPTPRQTIDGRVIHAGHVGTIYQAHNAVYTGRSRAREHALLPDGRCLSPRSLEKLRAAERGWRGVARQLVECGADPLLDAADRSERCAWLDRWLSALTRPLTHPGNFRYAWALNRRVRVRVTSRPYPKLVNGAIVERPA